MSGSNSRPVNGRTNFEQPLHLRRLVGGVEVHVQAILAELQLVRLLHGQVRTNAFRILQYDPIVIRRTSGNVLQGFLPEGSGPAEVFAVDNNRADLQHRPNDTPT